MSRQVISSQLVKWCVGVVAGVVYVVCLYGGFGRNADVAPMRLLLVASFLTFIASVALRIVTQIPILAMVLAFVVGMCGAILVDATLGSLFGKVDRNLFPVEIVVLTVVGIPGFIAGVSVSWMINSIQRSGRR